MMKKKNELHAVFHSACLLLHMTPALLLGKKSVVVLPQSTNSSCIVQLVKFVSPLVMLLFPRHELPQAIAPEQ